MYINLQNTTTLINIKFAISIVPSYKDSIVGILSIQNSIILIQTTEYNNFMLKWEQIHQHIILTIPIHLTYLLFCGFYEYYTR